MQFFGGGESMKASAGATYLHGDLDLEIIEARCLPNMDLMIERFQRFFTVFKKCGTDKKRNKAKRRMITSDPYVKACVAGATVARTRVIYNNQNPRWNERFRVPLAHPATYLEFHVKDNDLFGADYIGTATVLAGKFLSGDPVDDWFPIIGISGKPPKPNCAMHLAMRFLPCPDNPAYRQGLAGVRNSYFPPRPGGLVTLYQDAHVPDKLLPEVRLDDGLVFQHDKCWEDICHHILEAHHLVYITGWSIYHPVKLVREPTRPLPNDGNLNLGELLKYKSQEGVRVLLLVWDDKTSHSKFFINTAGVMQTHDEETRRFFKNSSVICALAPRFASSKLSIFKQQLVGTLFTHHQKCVIVDAQAHGNNRKISAFIGGLDLCDGRYDTPRHRLFSGLDTVFAEDFHNPTFPEGTKAPREPWHDLHCRIEGPAAYDVLTNFEQRWRKAAKWKELGRRLKRSTWHDDALIKLERMSWILPSHWTPTENPTQIQAFGENDPQNWNVQIFRSIDSGSLKGFPKNVYAAESQNLVCAKNLVIDKSIQNAYIEAIRSAQHFVYIENQYFLGSSYAWPCYRDAGADNLIPMELALKIASKIRANERFAVYVVIPMWPEGMPTSVSVQGILYWQGQTMQMMYEIIAAELKAMNIEHEHPQDYLNFYCLGNREPLPDDPSHPANTIEYGEVISSSQEFQRFMIYVHSKGMIVDDEYVILGSANINQRSMAGSRDTEIAMGAYQPNHTWGKRGRHPRGQVFGYRMSLWGEHLGTIDEGFEEADSLACVRSVNKIAEENWRSFTTDDFTPLQGHLLRYPLAVDPNGKIKSMPGFEYFPDVGGRVIGARSTTLPDSLTT